MSYGFLACNPPPSQSFAPLDPNGIQVGAPLRNYLPEPMHRAVVEYLTTEEEFIQC
jgi:hypothetical protein